MSGGAPTATTEEPQLQPLHNPLSPTAFATPSSPRLSCLALCLPPVPPPPPPPLPAFHLTPLLRRVTAALRSLTHPTRPFVTLTFAQSLDASLSYTPTPSTPPLILSSPASLRLTHYLRAIHSAILVGANTLQCDNPSLTCRLIEGAHSPTPVILEGGTTEVAATDDRKVIRPGTWVVVNERGVRPDRVGRLWMREGWEGGGEGETEKEKRIGGLLERGCRVLVLPCSSAASSHIAFPVLLSHLQPHFHSLMVEGGAGVITSLLQSEECVVDQVVLTVAPMLVGGWRSVQSRIGETGMRLHDMSCETCGADVILHAFTSPLSLSELSTMTAPPSVLASLSTVLSSLASSFYHPTARLLQHCLPSSMSPLVEPYHALVYSSIALPPAVLVCHAFLRLHAIRRFLPSSAAQRLERWTRWRVSLLLPALLLLVHYLLQQWSSIDRYSCVDGPDKRASLTRHASSSHEREMRVLPASIDASSAVSSTPAASPLLAPAQPYLLPFTSPSTTSGAPTPAPFPHHFSASASTQSALAAVSSMSKASVVLEAIKHNRRQSSGGSGGKRRQQQPLKVGWVDGNSGGENSATTSEGEAKEAE